MSMTKYLTILRGVNVHSIKEILNFLKNSKYWKNNRLIEKKLSAIWDVERLRQVLLPYDMNRVSNGLSRTKIHSLFALLTAKEIVLDEHTERNSNCGSSRIWSQLLLNCNPPPTKLVRERKKFKLAELFWWSKTSCSHHHFY